MVTPELHQFLLGRKSHLSEWLLTKYPDQCRYLVFKYEGDNEPSLFVSDLVISHKDDGFWGYVQNGAWNGLFRNDRVIMPKSQGNRIIPGKIIWLGNDYINGRLVFNMGVDENANG